MTLITPRLQLVLGLIAAIAIDTAIQIFWKVGVIDVPASLTPWTMVELLTHRPILLLVLALMLAQLINWLRVLALADLSFAKPITSLSYVTVSVVSYYVLGEHLHPVQVAGIGVIIIGVWFVSRGAPLTSALENS